MKLSIITVNLNNEEGLKRTIESVINQKFTDYEYLIIDGGSADASIDLVRNYLSYISHFVSEPDSGVYEAMNKGISLATGDYLLFLNSGDYLADSEALAQLLDCDTAADLIYGDMEQLYRDGSRTIAVMPEKISAEFLLDKTLCHPATLIKRSLFSIYGLYDTRYRIVADWAFFLKVILLGKVSYVHRNVVLSVFNMDGMSSSLSNQHFITKERKEVIENHFSAAILEMIYEKRHYEYYFKRFHLSRIIYLLQKLRKLGHVAGKSLMSLKQTLLYPVRTLRTHLELSSFVRRHNADCLDTPIIINNRNHLTYLKRLISSLAKRGYHNLYILDNGSDYPELLDYYHDSPYEVIRLGRNVGYCALWDTEVFARFKDQYYIYTDSDLELVDDCPDHFAAVLLYFLSRYPNIGKAGLSIRSDDIPEHYALKKQVLLMEEGNQHKRLEKMVFDARVDTTMALYRPNHFGDALKLKAIRVAYPFSVRHLPWYENTSALEPEQTFYYEHANRSSYWGSLLKHNKSTQSELMNSTP